MPTLRGTAGERRQSRTSESLSILKASPESAVVWLSCALETPFALI